MEFVSEQVLGTAARGEREGRTLSLLLWLGDARRCKNFPPSPTGRPGCPRRRRGGRTSLSAVMAGGGGEREACILCVLDRVGPRCVLGSSAYARSASQQCCDSQFLTTRSSRDAFSNHGAGERGHCQGGAKLKVNDCRVFFFFARGSYADDDSCRRLVSPLMTNRTYEYAKIDHVLKKTLVYYTGGYACMH